ncbi:MAG: N-methyl-L-tryptophan oxidase [Limisphaerales bacterium]
MYDAIVIGTGGVGSAALYHLARRGHKVLGLDYFSPGHDRGSSHGQTRIIRLSYFEHPDYVPLLRDAYSLWDELSEVRGEDLFHRTGLIYFGDPGGAVVQGLLASSMKHGLELQQLSESEAAKLYPGYVAPRSDSILYEEDAGYLRVEDCVRAHVEEAVRMGAEHRRASVMSWKPTKSSVVVVTSEGSFEAKRLIVTAGCWSEYLLQDLKIPLRIVRKHMHWFATDQEHYREDRGCPCFFYQANGGMFYGFPDIDGGGLKVAEHSGGEEVFDHMSGGQEEEVEDTRRIKEFLNDHLPGISMKRTRREVCHYTMSPDENFIVDRHPEHESVVFAAGLSGHGFKFTSALGKTLAELAMDGKSEREIGFLGVDRLR